uniref:M-phase inducer phosphatase n=1 Tax=Capitella teleta TaxID=283909 RepID=X1YZN3_CAPTE
MIADFSARYSLPRCQSKHSDLQGISPETVSNLLQGQYSAKIGKFTIVDCRYPYEYQGGHIQGAENIYTKTDIKHRFMTSNEFLKSDDSDKRNVIIFHCEFSSERGPRMCRYLREIDRQEHADQYPKLNYPEMYILEGGYKAFYEHKIDHCVPQSYLPMLHADHSQDLKHFRAKTKSMNGSKAGRRRPLRY